MNIGLNFLLIPPYGMLGAAWATLIAFTVQTTILVTIALRYYPIPYQWARMARLLGAAGALYAASMFLPPSSVLVTVALKGTLVAGFPVLLWLLGFFEPTELEQARQLRGRILKRLAPSRQ